MKPAVGQTHETGETKAAASEATNRRPALIHAPTAGVDSSAGAESFPVLPSTLLGLELLCRRPAFDLRAATRLVRDDPGAVLRLFRALAHDVSVEADLPRRLEDGLASLSRERLLRALAEGHADRGSSRIAAFTEHAIAVARCAEMVAGTLGLAAEPVRLVGLLHELGHAPAVLGWSAWPANAAVCCGHLARAHGLPGTLRRALDEVHREARDSVWTAVVAAAHELLPTRA